MTTRQRQDLRAAERTCEQCDGNAQGDGWVWRRMADSVALGTAGEALRRILGEISNIWWFCLANLHFKYCFVGSLLCSKPQMSQIQLDLWQVMHLKHCNENSSFLELDSKNGPTFSGCDNHPWLQGPQAQCACRFLHAARSEANWGWQMGWGHPANSHTGSGWHSNTSLAEPAHYRQEL